MSSLEHPTEIPSSQDHSALAARLSITQVEEERFQNIARRAIERDNVPLLGCVLELPSDELIRRYQDALAFEDVRKYTATQRNKKERLLLKELDAFFRKHPNVESYANVDLQNLKLTLDQELLAHDKEAFTDMNVFLEARTAFAANNRIYRIQHVGGPEPKQDEKKRADNDKLDINVSDFQAYIRDYRPFEFSSPEMLSVLAEKILSLDTPDKLQHHIQALRLHIADLENAERLAQVSLNDVGLASESYQQESYLRIQAEEMQEKEGKVNRLLEDDHPAEVLEILQCRSREEAKALLTRQWDCRPMSDVQADAELAEKTLYVDIVENRLKYQVRNLDGTPGSVTDTISQNDLLTYQIPGSLNLKALKIHLKAILDITAQRGHTPPMPKISAFFLPETSVQKISLFNYAQSIQAHKTLAFMQERYASLEEICSDIAHRKADLEAQARLSCHDSNDVLILQKLALFYQEDSEKSPGLKDNALSLFYYARAYIVSGEEPYKEKYEKLYSHPETTLLDKQQLFSKLLEKNIENGRLLALLEWHSFSDLGDVSEVLDKNKPLMAYILGFDLRKLFQPIDLFRSSGAMPEQAMMHHVFKEPHIPDYVKQQMLDFYLDCFSRNMKWDPQSPIVQEIGFYLRQAICDTYLHAEASADTSQPRRFHALSALGKCDLIEIKSHIEQLNKYLAELNAQQTNLTHSFREELSMALIRYDGMQKMAVIEARMDKALGISETASPPLEPSKPIDTALPQYCFKVHVKDAKDDAEWMHFEMKKISADGDCGFLALQEILRNHNSPMIVPIRQAFAQWLSENKENAPIKEALCFEMMSALKEGKRNAQGKAIDGLNIAGSQACYEIYVSYMNDRESLIRQIRTRSRHNPFPAGLSEDQLISLIRTSPQDYVDDQEDLANYDARDPNAVTRAFCSQPDVIDAYIAGLGRHRWLGIPTAILFAKSRGIALTTLIPNGVKGEARIFRECSSKEQHPELAEAYLLFNGRDHFDIAIRKNLPSPTPESEVAAAANMSMSDAAIVTSEHGSSADIPAMPASGPVEVQEKKEEEADSAFYCSHHHMHPQDTGFDVFRITRQQLVTVLLTTLHENNFFRRETESHKALCGLLPEVYKKLLLDGRLDSIATEEDVEVKNNYEKNRSVEENRADYLKAERALIKHCKDLKNLSRFIQFYIGENGHFPFAIAQWYLGTQNITCTLLEEKLDGGRKTARFVVRTAPAKQGVAQADDKEILVYEDGHTEHYARVAQKENNGKMQLRTMFLYVLCLRYLYLNVSQGPQPEDSLATKRLLYFLAEVQKTENADTIFSNVKKLLDHPLFFENGKPSVIGSAHVMLLNIFETRAPEMFKKCIANKSNHKGPVHDIEAEIEHISRKVREDIAIFLTGLHEEAKKYEQAFKRCKQLKAAPWKGWLPFFENLQETEKKINTLIVHCHSNVVPAGMKSLQQFNALLNIQTKFEYLNATQTWILFKTDKSQAEFKKRYKKTVRKPSMKEDHQALCEGIDHAGVEKRETADTTVHVLKSIDRAYMYGADPEADISKHKEISLRLTQSILNRFHYVLCKEASRLLADREHTVQLGQMIQSSPSSPLLPLDPGHLQNLEGRVVALASKFAVLPSQAAGDVSNLSSTAIAILGNELAHYFQEQLDLIRVEHHERFAKFLAEMVFLYACTGEKFSLTGLLNWLDTGPVLYRKATLYEGPKVALTTREEEVTCMALISLSGHRCHLRGQEIRYTLRTSQHPSRRPHPEIYGCKTIITDLQLENLREALRRAYAHGPQNEKTGQPCWIDGKTVASTQYKDLDLYQVIPNKFKSVEVRDELEVMQEKVSKLEKNQEEQKKEEEETKKFKQLVIQKEAALQQQLVTQKAESEQVTKAAVKAAIEAERIAREGVLAVQLAAQRAENERTTTAAIEAERKVREQELATQKAESDRKIAESDRKIAESDRKIAESDRKIAESKTVFEQQMSEQKVKGDQRIEAERRAREEALAAQKVEREQTTKASEARMEKRFFEMLQREKEKQEKQKESAGPHEDPSTASASLSVAMPTAVATAVADSPLSPALAEEKRTELRTPSTPIPQGIVGRRNSLFSPPSPDLDLAQKAEEEIHVSFLEAGEKAHRNSMG